MSTQQCKGWVGGGVGIDGWPVYTPTFPLVGEPNTMGGLVGLNLYRDD